ncbi:MAG: carbohydrate binding family 9 domain-containing protein [Saprospiraceae bacterium]|nr:carbohydrate binding family 9 domain-containing protein [Saprospiraceae bacterium]
MKKFLFICFIYIPTFVFSQKDSLGEQRQNHLDFQIKIKKAETPITIDGVLEEKDWSNADVAKNFWRKYPDNRERAATKTEARLTYDAHFLYIGFICYDSTDKHIIPTLKRDIDYFDGDGIAVLLDPINRQSNAYLFGSSPLGVQSETDVQSFGDLTFSWDTKWFNAVKQYPDRWTVEIAIPFKSLRYEAGKQEWGINFIRNDIKHGQYHTWARVPMQYQGTQLGFYGTLVWDAPPPVEKSNVALIPYILAGAANDFEVSEKTDKVLRGGLDAKIALNSQLNLDATINPDFSQVDVDVQQTNLTRFSLFFPERRIFFLENNDVLSELGSPPANRPFFSRRIGLDADGQRVPIQYGVRLSGNLNKTLRINALNIQTAATNGQGAYNYSAAAMQQALVGRSFFKVGLLNRQGVEDGFKFSKTDYKRDISTEFSFTSKNNRWDAWLLLHHSLQHNIKNDNNYLEGGFWYHNEKWQFLNQTTTVGSNYATGMEFFQRIENYDALLDTTFRIGYKQNFSMFYYNYVPKNSQTINNNETQVFLQLILNPNNSLNDRYFHIENNTQFKNTSTISVQLDNDDNRLPVHTAFTDDTPLPPDKYIYTFGTVAYNSDKRKKFLLASKFTFGEFYNGKQLGMSLGFTFRKTPIGVFSLLFERYDLQFPAPYNRSLLYLINSKTELSFTKNLIWTTFLQYNTQANNFNVNSRLQWRYKPMSDLFIVFTDNHGTLPFVRKNRALVLKMNYWFNL